MRVFVLIFSIVALSACTTIDSSISPEVTDMVQSKISQEKYSSSLQKTIPSPTYGTGKHNVTIYADFQCPACITFSQLTDPLFESYAEAGKITITYKQFPLTNIHKNAYRDAIAALCGAEFGGYLDVKKAIYNLEAEKRWATVTDVERISALVKVWLDKESITQCLADNRYAAQVDAEVAEWNTARISGTPTVLLNGNRLDLWAIFADMEKGKAFLDRTFSN